MTQDSTVAGAAGMMTPPGYFENVKANASRRWDQLEGDQELAGPWLQLFRQVQSPRHVLSELLQNADDAGARKVVAGINNNTFIFGHDGNDFSADDFGSLCRFGFSNKRNLHTIGFRGIGFKSTFSLGDRVEVRTPSLAVQFRKARFTEPHWIPNGKRKPYTVIRVKIEDQDRGDELQKNLDEWAKSAVSLLFFTNIHELKIGETKITREPIGPGPVPNSEWIRLTDTTSHKLLVVRSEEQEFPDEAYVEVKNERFAEQIDLPPCRVEIVAGLSENRLFVVLPTDVRPALPFCCNAPFIQDPARTGIKSPSTSPTNRWLLSRIGKLAANTMLGWLNDDRLQISERADAYRLLRSPASHGNSLANDCETRICKEYEAVCREKPILLTTDGSVVSARSAIAPPVPLYSVWSNSQLARIFGDGRKPILAGEIESPYRGVLAAWNWLDAISEHDAVTRLNSDARPPRPDDWPSLIRLWEFVRSASRNAWTYREFKIVPVEHSNELYSAEEVVRLARGKGLANQDDWDFLSKHVIALDRDWLAFLSKEKDQIPDHLLASLRSANEMLRTLRLEGTSSWDKVVAVAAQELFTRKELEIEDEVVRLTHIMAAVQAKVPPDFSYVTRDCELRGVDHGIILDPSGRIEDLVPSDWAQAHMLHVAYTTEFRSCEETQWNQWARSESSGLSQSLTLAEKSQWYSSIKRFEDFLKSRHVDPPDSYNYRSEQNEVTDYDFDDPLRNHWDVLSESEPTTWSKVARLILEMPAFLWKDRCLADAREVSQNGSYTKPTQCGPIPATWITRLRSKPCLPDTFGNLRQPAELFMRTPETEPLMGVEPFVQSEYDTAETKDLLRHLGLRDTPAGPEKIVERIRALTRTAEPLIHEIGKWYDALDRVLSRCRQDELRDLREAFGRERMILTNDSEWATSDEVFRHADEEDVPDAPVIHHSVAELSMWGRLGVAERPTVDLVIKWLDSLKSDDKLSTQDLKRVRNYLTRFALRIWEQCQRWLALDSHWRPVDGLAFALARGSDARIGDLFPAMKAKSADFRGVPAEVVEQPPFSIPKNLGSAIQYRLTEADTGFNSASIQPWMTELGDGLQRIRFKDDQQTQQIRLIAARLKNTIWQPFNSLRVTPYIAGEPVGQPHSPSVLWDDRKLYVEDRPLVEIIKTVGDELSKFFEVTAISEAIKYCAGRDATFIRSYLEHNFDLDDELSEPTEGESLNHTDRPVMPDGSGDSATPTLTVNDAEREEDERPDRGDEDLKDVEPERTQSEHDDRQSQKSRAEPKLIERFASAGGFAWSAGRQMYVRADGATLRRSVAPFSWELYSATGELQRRYWLSEQTLSKGSGVEVTAELWDLLSQSPDQSALVLLDEYDKPIEWRGSQLVSMVQSETVGLFPAKYRLRTTVE